MTTTIWQNVGQIYTLKQIKTVLFLLVGIQILVCNDSFERSYYKREWNLMYLPCSVVFYLYYYKGKLTGYYYKTWT